MARIFAGGKEIKVNDDLKVITHQSDALSIADTYRIGSTFYGQNSEITDIPQSIQGLNSQSSFLVVTREAQQLGFDFIYQFILWDGGALLFRASWQGREKLVTAQWHKINLS